MRLGWPQRSRSRSGIACHRNCGDVVDYKSRSRALARTDDLLAATKDTVVIGIDGVAEAKALIDSGTSPFRASVVQDTHELALGIVDLLVKMHRGRRFPRRKILEPSIFETDR
jgi:hypothetical protein